MVELVVEKPWFEGKPTSLLAMGIFEDKDKDHKNLSKYIGTKSADALEEILSGKAFVGKFGTSFLLPLIGNRDIKKILLLGLGKKEKFTRETARIMAGKSALKSREINETNFSIFPFGEAEEEFIEPMAEGILLSLYDFDRYKTANSESGDSKIHSVKLLVSEGITERVQVKIGRVQVITQAVNFARELSNLPPNDCSPSQLIGQCLTMAHEFSLRTTVLERYQMESIGLNGIV